MRNLKITLLAFLFLTCCICYILIREYDSIDAYNQASCSFQWVSRTGGDAIHIRKTGKGRDYMIALRTGEGVGVLDENCREILPCEYESVSYGGGEYIAAATLTDYKLFNRKGREAASFDHISFPYAYAGDRYFIRYGDDHIEHWKDGFEILDAISGETVAVYDDCYNAVRLDDGSWYISRTPDVRGAAMRWVPLEPYGSLTGDPREGETEPPEGFFVSRDFEELFVGNTYRLICQGNGLYVAEVLEKADAAESAEQEAIVVMDETGELFQVEDEAALKRIGTYENKGDLIYETRTVFRGEGGLIGFAPLDQMEDIVYVDEKGRRVKEKEAPGYGVDARYSLNQGMTLFCERKGADGLETMLYGIKEPSGTVLLPPIFEEITFLPDTENILVNGKAGCGVIRLEDR